MNRWVEAFCRRIMKPILYIWQHNLVKDSFKLNKEGCNYTKKESIVSSSEVNELFIYKDESWNSIKYIYKLMWNDLFKMKFLQYTSDDLNEDNLCVNKKVSFCGNEIICRSKNIDNDWFFLLINKELKDNYLVEFEAVSSYENTEFQFAFNYSSIGMRYRFNLVDNKELSFEVVYNGFFYNKIFSIPLSLEVNISYNFKIAVKGNSYSFILNDKTVLSVLDEKRILKKGKPVLILWDSKSSNIEVTYKDINIYNI
jgi:hypothetical protein